MARAALDTGIRGGDPRYLPSPEASFVTSEILHVNGGRVFGR
jgi:hypothetical protein